MKVVCHKTGLPPETLRAWERRYTGIAPGRDARKRRVYSEELMEKLILLSMLVDTGYRIGDIAGLAVPDLRRMVDELATPTPAAFTPSPSLERAIDAVLSFETDELWNELERATTVYGRLDLIDEFVFPLIHSVKQRIESDDELDVHHGFLCTTLRTFLSTLLTPVARESERPVVAIAYPIGQRCHVGAVASAVHVHAAGWRPLLLGDNIPAEQIVTAAQRAGAAALIVVAVAENYDTRILTEFRRVRFGTPKSVPVYFGGHVPPELVTDIQEAGLIPLSDMDHLRVTLSERRTIPESTGVTR